MQDFKGERITHAILVAAEYALRLKNIKEINGVNHPDTERKLAFAIRFIKAMAKFSGLGQIQLRNIETYARSHINEAINEIFDELLEENEAPNATDPLSRH